MNLHPIFLFLVGFLWASLGLARAADVRDFGAKGDGVADDRAAIQQAVNSGAGTIHFSRGTYRLSGTVVIALDKIGCTSLAGEGTARIVMAAAGPAFKFVGTHEGSADPKDFKANVWERQRTPMVDGLEIVGAHPEADGLEATGTMQLTITRVTVREARHGIHLTVRNRNVIISDCHLYHNRGVGVFYDHVNLHQSNIIGSHISYNAGGGVVSRGGAVRNLQIGTCDIESNMTPDGPPTANVLLDCREGSIAEVAIVGCTLQHNPAPGGANIRFLGKGEERGPVFASETTRWGHLTIANNVLSDVQVNIHVQHVRGVVIEGNTFGPGYEHDLLVEDSSNVVIGPNSFDRNPRYIYGVATAMNGGLVFRDSRDCTLTGLHINGVRRKPGAVVLDRCDAFNLCNCTILDSDGPGLLLRGVSNSLVTGCLIRDNRTDRQPAPSLRVEGGSGNIIANNKLAHGSESGPAGGAINSASAPPAH